MTQPPDHAQVDADLAGYEQAVEAAQQADEQTVTDLQGQLAADEAKIAQLEAELAGRVFGVGIDLNAVEGGTMTQAAASARKLFPNGLGPGCKGFGNNAPTDPMPSWSEARNALVKIYQYGTVAGERHPDLCSTYAAVADLNTVLDSLTVKTAWTPELWDDTAGGVPIRVTVHQEYTAHIKKGDLTKAGFLTDCAAVAQAVRAHPNAHLVTITPIANDYPILFDGFETPDVTLAGVDFDELGVDFYVSGQQLLDKIGTVTAFVQRVSGWAKVLGKPFRFPEFGVAAALPNQAALLQEMVDACKADPACTGFGYWLSSVPTGKWYPNPDAVKVLQQAIAAS